MMSPTEVLDEITEALERGDRTYAIEMFEHERTTLSNRERERVLHQIRSTRP